MPWVRLDDGFYDNPKVLRAGDAAIGLYARALSYCGRHLTDGFVPTEFVRHLSAVADRLVRAKLWERVPDGFRVHDYLAYNPSRAQARQKRRLRAEAGRTGGRASGSVRRNKIEANAEAKSKPKSSNRFADASQTYEPRTRTRSRSRTHPEPGPTPEHGVQPQPPNEGRNPASEAISTYRALPGVEPSKRDGAVIGALVKQYGADHVRAAIDEAGPKIVAATNSLSYLCGVVQRLVNGTGGPAVRPNTLLDRIEQMRREDAEYARAKAAQAVEKEGSA